MKKKVIIIAYDLNPYIGSEAGVSFIWSQILSKEYDLTIFTQSIHKVNLETFGSELTINYIDRTPYLSKFLTRFHLYNIDYSLFIRKVKKAIGSDNKIDVKNSVIHFMSPFGIHSYSDLARDLKVPYIVGPAGGYLVMPKGFEAYRKLPMILKEFFYGRLLKNKNWKFYFENAKAIVCGTDLVAKHLPLIAQNKVSIIYDSVVDTEYFNPAGSTRQETDQITIVFTGRLVLYKGVFLLLKAFERISREHPNVMLIYAGEGHERTSLERYVTEKNLTNRVVFTGRINREQLKMLLLNSDIYCLPTLKDPGGNAILEAMACGLPVISTNYGGPAYSVAENCGVLIDPISIEDYVLQLSDALIKLIEDETLRKSLGGNAREHVITNFSSSELQNRILSFYKKALS